jgi:hypothetical protein
MRRRCVLAVLIGCMIAVPVLAVDRPVDRPQCNAKLGAGDAVFCDGYYALCIKALCRPTPGQDKAECVCTVEQGWSMGPAPCSAVGRSQAKPAPGGPIMSTYSNYFNPKDQTLTCSSDTTKWAWCFGAPCKVDGPKGATATCICPICTGQASTLGGRCVQSNCNKIWSAATPTNDQFANTYFYEHLKKQGVEVPPPAAACTNGATPAH